MCIYDNVRLAGIYLYMNCTAGQNRVIFVLFYISIIPRDLDLGDRIGGDGKMFTEITNANHAGGSPGAGDKHADLRQDVLVGGVVEIRLMTRKSYPEFRAAVRSRLRRGSGYGK